MGSRTDISPLSLVMQRVDAIADGAPAPDTIETGFPSVDKLLGGGVRRGDLVVLGWRGAELPTVAYAWEFGSHGGVSPDEIDTFMIHPRPCGERFDAVTRPAELHRFFMETYRRPSPPLHLRPPDAASPGPTEPCLQPEARAGLGG